MNNINQTLFDIIMPVYNTDLNLLKRAINSVLNQTYKNFRLIIINDGSTEENVNQFLFNLNNPKIFYRRINNVGPSGARNAGLVEVKGDYFLYLDSDDYYEENLLEEINKVIINNGAKLILFGISSDFIKTPKVTKIKKDRLLRDEVLKCDKDLNDARLYSTIWSKCYYKMFLKYKFNENISLGEDRLYLLQILNDENLDYLYLIKKGLYFYNITQGSLTRSDNKSRVLKVYNFLNEIVSSIENNDKIPRAYYSTLCFEVIYIFDAFISNKSVRELKSDVLFKEIFSSKTLKRILKYHKPFYNGFNNEVRFALIKLKFYKIYKLIYDFRKMVKSN